MKNRDIAIEWKIRELVARRLSLLTFFDFLMSLFTRDMKFVKNMTVIIRYRETITSSNRYSFVVV